MRQSISKWQLGGKGFGLFRLVNAKALAISLSLLMLTAIFACTSNDPTPQPVVVEEKVVEVDKISIATTTNLIQDWVENVGGDRVEVTSIIPHDVDPHAFKPTPKDLKGIEASSLFILVGNQYEESWVQDAVNNTNQVSVELSTEIWGYLNTMDDLDDHDDHDKDHDDHEDHDKDHDDHAGHDHGDHGYDLHFWHDPTKVVSAIDAISQALVKMDPGSAEYYIDNASRYKQELVDIDKWISSELSVIPDERRVLITNHETMGYFADRYDFEVLGSVIPGFSSSPEANAKDLAKLMDVIEEHNVNVLFGEPQMREKLANSIASDSGVTVAVLHSEVLGAEGSGAETYIDMLKVNVGIIVDSLTN